MPLSVKLLAQYDAWLNEDKDTWENLILPYQYGVRLYKTNPVQKESEHIWDTLFDSSLVQFDPSLSIDNILIEGKAVLKYEKSRLGRLAKSCSFEATFSGMRALCVNSCSKSSMSLEKIYDTDKHDLMLVYNQVPNKDGTLSLLVSLYTTKDGIDCSKIAKSYGGGGHVQAAGFKAKSFDWVKGEAVFTI
jgi:oligoribonuclease NrnB/cAMP/cGMP phosphodiesterase (DHH superfamily)